MKFGRQFEVNCKGSGLAFLHPPSNERDYTFLIFLIQDGQGYTIYLTVFLPNQILTRLSYVTANILS